MLPYLIHEGEISCEREPTPLRLNHRARRGDFDGACLSAIAGFNIQRSGIAGVEPLQFGVGARGAVGSVYLEPVEIFQSGEINSHFGEKISGREFWKHFREKNNNSLVQKRSEENFDFQQLQLGKMVEDEENKPLQVTILASAASEQSEWLVRQLIAAQDYELVFKKIETPSNLFLPSELSLLARTLQISGPCALLVIGDPALERRMLFSGEEVAGSRLDVATLWQDATGLPCIFASWFSLPRRVENKVRQSRENLSVGEDLLQVRTEIKCEVEKFAADAVNRWNAFSAERKWNSAKKFLSKNLQSSLLLQRVLANEIFMKEFLLHYLEGLSFKFDDEFSKNWKLYVDR